MIKLRRRRDVTSSLFFYFLPSLILVLFLLLYPLAYECLLSFQQKVAGVYVYVGLKNFVDLFSSDLFWHSLLVTITYGVGTVGLAFLWGLVLALLMNEKFKGRAFFRTILLLPWAVPLVVVSLGFRWIFNEKLGIANYLLTSFTGMQPVSWLGNETWAMFTAIAVNSWQIAPFGMVMILGALQSVPKVLYEAAEIDGAASFFKFLHITVPCCRGAMSTVLLMEIIWSFCSFTVMFLLTEGGPLNATLILPLYIYRLGFKEFDFGSAGATSVVLLLIMSSFTLFYLKYIKRGEYSAA